MDRACEAQLACADPVLLFLHRSQPYRRLGLTWILDMNILENECEATQDEVTGIEHDKLRTNIQGNHIS